MGNKSKYRIPFWIVLLFVIFGIITVISLLFPWVFDNFMLGKAQKSNLEIEQWAGFMGSYAGGIIGGLLGSAATILGVYLTINQQQAQVSEERRLSVRPALYFSKLEEGEKDGLSAWSVYDINVAKTQNAKTEECSFCFKTNNIGPGIIIKIMLNIIGINKDNSAEGQEYSLTNCGETRYWRCDFNVTYDADDKYFYYPLILNFYYSDIYNNVYIQTMQASVQKSRTEEDGKEIDSPVGVCLFSDITEPKLVKKIPGYMRGWQI